MSSRRESHADCVVDGCTRRSRSRLSGPCETHYYRMRRTGTYDEPFRLTGNCLVDGCAKSATSHRPGERGTEGYCRMHYLRLKKHGDTNFEMSGENHPHWVGDGATYFVLHARVSRAFGSPKTHDCADCDGPAQQWSYDHNDPDERFEEGKGPYSLDINRYVPRCISCHKKFDLAHIQAVST